MYRFLIYLLFVAQEIGGSLNLETIPDQLFYYNKLLYPNPARRNDRSTKPLETVNVVVYYESFCKDSRDFFTSQLVSAYELLQPYLDVRLIPYGKATTKIVDSSKYYTFKCHHGPSECYGNMLHACALDILFYAKTAHMFNTCLMDFDHTDKGSDDSAAKKCGNALGIDVEAVKECAKNKTGTFLHNYYGQQTKLTTFNYVPHVLVNGKRSNTSLISDICTTLAKPPPNCKISLY